MAEIRTSNKRDPDLVSSEPWEVEYIHKQFPNRSHAEVVQALKECKEGLPGTEQREKIMECVRQKLG